MRKGSITPFCAMALMLIASLLFALLESARFCGLNRYATLKSETVMDSVCAEYQPYLWQEYGLLFLDGAYGTEQFSMGYVMERFGQFAEANCETTEWLQDWFGLDLFRLKKSEVLLEGYALATDDNGELFLNYVAQRAKEGLPLGMAEEVYRQYQKAVALEDEYGTALATVAEAQETVAEVKSQWVMRQEEELNRNEEEKKEYPKREASEPATQIMVPDTSAVDEILDSVSRMKSSGTLHLILGDLSGISANISKPDSPLETRSKEVGTMYLKAEKDWYQKLLVLNYLETYFSNYLMPRDTHFLRYEMEYVLCGKESEWENLNGTLDRMLLLREAANVAYLLKDAERMAQAEELAGMIGLLAGGNYGVVKAVQIGLISAWAYAESVLDVRALVQGKEIPLIKQATEWTTGIDDIFSALDKQIEARPCASGMNYTDYLKQLLFLTPNQKLSYRMMEVMEIGMQSRPEYMNCRMDHMIVMLRLKAAFESRPVFSALVSIGDVYDGDYIFKKEIERSYVP